MNQDRVLYTTGRLSDAVTEDLCGVSVVHHASDQHGVQYGVGLHDVHHQLCASDVHC